ncbi:MAG: hypothetical protein R2706_16415 [Acidimicrobiales bacterium]
MSETIVVGLAMSSRPWRSSLHRHCRDHASDVAIRLIRDGREALEAGIDVVVVDDDTSWLSAPVVAGTRDNAITIVGLFDPNESDGHGRRHLQRLGIDVTLSADLGPDELLSALRVLRPDRDLADQFRSVVGNDAGRIAPTDRTIVAVGGPAGAGATEVAIALAAATSERTILVDVDESHPSIARRLGLSIHPHILTAIEALRGERIRPDGTDGERLEDCLASRVVGGAALPFDVVAGLACRDDWNLLRADDTLELVEELAARWPVVVVRLGPRLEDLSRWVGRFDVSRSVAAKAGRVVGVCEGTTSGLLRFVDWLVDVTLLVGDAPIDVVINRAPSSVAARAQLEQQLREIVGSRVGRIETVGFDKRIERASWDGELANRGPLVKTVREFA